MKRKTLLLVCLAICVHILASGVSPEQASAIAQSFMMRHRPSVLPHQVKMASVRSLSHRAGKETSAYYVFNVGNDEGFVVVSGDDRTVPVLGYADHGSFEEETIPDNMRAWLHDYAAQIDFLNRTSESPGRPRLVVPHQAIAPMLTSHWGQNAPYNDQCPTDPSTKGRCVTGCVATALAQVIYYHKYPEATKERIPGYYTDTQKIWVSSSYVTTIDWKYLLDSYQGQTTSIQRSAVANLMSLCGKAVNMDYNERASGANLSTCVKALQTYFGYDKTTRILKRTAFSGEEWESLIYEELSYGRPVLYGGSSTGGGHAFVVDGYDGEGFFHINWGWNGSNDGYFQLSILNPYNTESEGASSSNDGYSFSQDAVVGIQHGSWESVAERFTAYDILVSGSNSFTRLSPNHDFSGIGVQIKVVNNTGDTHQFYLGLALCNNQGEMLSVIAQQESVSSVASYYGGTKTFSACSFGAYLPDGDYFIIPVSMTENSANWEPCWGANNYRIKAVIKDNTLTLSDPVKSLNGTIQPIGAVTEFKNCQVTAQIVNSGTRFVGDIFLFEGSTRVGGRTLEAEEGETVDFSIDYIPTTAGEKKLILAYSDGEQYVPIASQTLSVKEDRRTISMDYIVQLTNAVGRTVKEDKVVVKVEVENKGDAYDDAVAIYLYKLNTSNGRYESVANQKKQLSLSEKEKALLEFTFDIFEHQTEYLVIFCYRGKGKWIDDGWAKYATFDTDLPQPKIVGKVSVRNADSNGNVPETTVYAKAAFVNAGEADMVEGMIDICLEKYDESKQNYVYFNHSGFTFDDFIINEADSFFMGFKNLVPETKYRTRLRYYVGENGEYIYVDGSEQYFQITANAQAKDYHLAVTYDLLNVADEVMTGNQLNYNVQVKNDGENDYDLTIVIRIFEIDDYGELNFFSEIHHDLTLPIGSSKTISSKSPTLIEGHRYQTSCCYLDFQGYSMSAPWTQVESKSFKVSNASSVNEIHTVPSAEETVTVRSMDGQKVGTMAASEINRLPRGLYLISSEKGTKKYVKQ